MGEELREAVAMGDENKVRELLSKCDSSTLNSQNSMNGWTALHWACKRGYASIVDMLVKKGAKTDLKNNKEETAADLTTDGVILCLLGGIKKEKVEAEVKLLPIVPNYLSNPPFPYTSGTAANAAAASANSFVSSVQVPPSTSTTTAAASLRSQKEVLLRIRVADIEDEDYYEMDLPPGLTYDQLLKMMCEELEVQPSDVKKVRKRPNIVVRKDRDVARLTSYDSLELVLNDDCYHD